MPLLPPTGGDRIRKKKATLILFGGHEANNMGYTEYQNYKRIGSSLIDPLCCGVPTLVAVGIDTNGNNIYTSTDHGNTWIPRAAFGLGGAGFTVIVDTTATPPTLIAGGRSSSTGLIMSGGSILTSIKSGTQSVLQMMMSAPTGGQNICTSIDHGATWTPRPAFGSGFVAALLLDTTASTIIAGGANQTDGYGIYISKDHGVSWIPKTAFPGGTCYALATDPVGSPTGSTRIVAVGFDLSANIYVSDDHGDTWQPRVANDPTTGGTFYAIVLDTTISPSRLIIVGNDISGNNVYVSDDHGDTWSPKQAFGGLTGLGRAVIVDDSGVMPTIIGVGNAPAIPPPPYGNICISTDHGDTWVPEEAYDGVGGGQSVVLDTTGPQPTLVSVGYGVAGDNIYTSTDHGNTWVPRAAFGDGFGYSVIVDTSASPSRLIACGYGPDGKNIVRSDDHGVTWIPSNGTPFGVGALGLGLVLQDP